jgi:hypothetical protein
MKSLLTVAALAAMAGAANAGTPVELGRAVDAGGADNFVSGYTGRFGFSSAGDMFGIDNRLSVDPLPFAVLDDSAGSFTGDTQGIIDSNDNGNFFGVVDTENADNSGVLTASWTFDVAGFTSLEASGLFAAMGDFEDNGADVYDFTWSIDGSAPTPLFTSSVDEAGSQNYTMESGTPVSLDDPLLLNGTLLDNDFQSLTAAISGTGSLLTIEFSATTNGGDEAFAFRNLVVTGIPTPGSLALVGIAGLAAARRRRA